MAILAFAEATPAPVPDVRATRVERDGARDFDFKRGRWTTRIRRLREPLSGSSAWSEMSGTVTVRDVWEGRALLEEIDAVGAAGRFESLTLFLYDPSARQWRMSFSNRADGTLSVPMVGSFDGGRGTFIDQETYGGRTILARVVWSDITADGHRFEQSFSDDGGRTWETNFVAVLTRAAS